MAAGLTPQQLAAYQQSSNPWEWNQWAQTQDPGLYGWRNMGGIGREDLAHLKPALQAAGLWKPEYDNVSMTMNPETDGGGGGYTSAGPDLSPLSGYGVGNARSLNGTTLTGYVGPDGRPIMGAAGGVLNGRATGAHSSLTGGDYAVLASVPAAGLLAAYGFGAGASSLGTTASEGTPWLMAGDAGYAAPSAAATGGAGGGLTTQLGTSSLQPVAYNPGEFGGVLNASGAPEVAGGGASSGSLSFSSPGLGTPSAGAFGTTGYSVPAFQTGAASGLSEYASAIKTAASLAGGLSNAYYGGQAGQQASQLQQQAARQGQQQLQPYAQAGVGALKQQQDLAGINGPQAQQAAIDALKASPGFQSQLDLGERSILAHASATGGLRGGNTQAALAQFSPQLLSNTINQQYGMLGQMATNGQNAAGGVSNLIQQGGSAAAGGALAGGKAQAGYWSALGNAAGLYAGLNGW